ncbi:hypothetical protein ABZV31_35585 [Streptomyces sp. NPDC005202]|uniref:nSTAND1 domain-containing NTPase n=1 Tax=Streptomyces sp. NPDC005202 TaxID=3157021 RepID=UPI0033B0252B
MPACSRSTRTPSTLPHEALISGWPRLRGWTDSDRERVRTHRRLTEAARAWEVWECNPGGLYRGARLAAVEESRARRPECVGRGVPGGESPGTR